VPGDLNSLVGIPLLFEVVSLLLSPYISTLTCQTLVLMLLITVLIESARIPLHNKPECQGKVKLAHKVINSSNGHMNSEVATLPFCETIFYGQKNKE
jgi:hypothetical protein